jgi:hypothetical protein
MAGTYTSRLALYKPAADGSDNVNVVTDLNNNLDRLDALVSFVPVTASTYPASAFQGEAFYETDTGKAYVNKSAVASSADFYQIMVAGADFDSDMTFNGSVVASGGHFESWRASAATRILAGDRGHEPAHSDQRGRVHRPGLRQCRGGRDHVPVRVGYLAGVRRSVGHRGRRGRRGPVRDERGHLG